MNSESNLMALYTVTPEWLAPGNWSVPRYWQIRGNIKFLYGTLEEAKSTFPIRDNLPFRGEWIYDATKEYYYSDTKQSFELDTIRDIIRIVKGGSMIDMEEEIFQTS